MKKIITIFALMPILCFGQWTQVGNPINGQTANDRCGTSTAISADGSIVAIGSANSSSSFSNAGQVRVFGFNNSAWSQIGADINGESSGDQTGQSVSLSNNGSILAIGEPFNDDLGFVSGQVRVFRNINNSWTQVGQDLFGENSSAEGGRSVDLSADGSIVAFGAPNTNVNGVFFAGKVKVFVNQNNNWVQKGGDINGDGKIIKFGNSVSLSDDGNTIAIGQSGDPSNRNPVDTGRVKVYKFVGNQWVQLGNTIFESGSRGEFGYRISLSSSGTILAIGSYSISEVKVFELTNGTWSQIGNTLIGNGAGDSFGFSLSLSSSGSRLAVGARFLSVSNDQPGSVYLFERQGSNWVLIGNPIVGVAQADQAGFSVAISRDGTKVAVGSTGNDAGGNNAGHVRIFKNSSIVNIDDFNETDLVKLYPNPASKVIQIQSKDAINSYEIFSIDGRMVERRSVSNLNEFYIDIDDLVSGMYLLTIQTQSTKKSLKFLKE
jgi:hypothetical protein